jgi:hypothetical protein
MDPITQAVRRFAEDAEDLWHDSPHTLLALVAHEDQREDVVEALRVYEATPENRRPFIVFRAPFDAANTYFSVLAEQVAADYERVRKGVAEEGVELPAFVIGDDGTVPSGAIKRAALTMNQAARLLGERFAGIVVALVPEHVVDVSGWRENVRVLAETRWSPRVRVAVFAPLGGPLCEVLKDGGALFDVAPDELMNFVKELTPVASGGPAVDGENARAEEPGGEGDASGSPSAEAGAQLRRLLLDAAAALGAGRPVDAVTLYREARTLCQVEALAEQEVAVLMALGGAYLAADVPALGVESYRSAALLAEHLEAWPAACQAWLGVGAAYLPRENYVGATVGFRAAAVAAKRADSLPLRIEALRLVGTCLLHLGREDEAMLAWKEAVDVGAEADAAERSASTFDEVARALVKLLERHGLTRQAQHVQATLERGNLGEE